MTVIKGKVVNHNESFISEISFDEKINQIRKIPKFEYDAVELVDVFRRIAFTEETLNSLESFVDYVVPDGYTPDRCALEFYGDANWFWVVLLSNNILSVEGEWPKSQNKIQRKFTVYLKITNH